MRPLLALVWVPRNKTMKQPVAPDSGLEAVLFVYC